MAAAARIGRIRLKSNGAEIRLLPDAVARRHIEVRTHLGQAVRNVDRIYDGDLCGFALVVWDRESGWMAEVSTDVAGVGINVLPEFVAAAIRRRIAKDDAEKILD